jgi:hypothetical protein
MITVTLQFATLAAAITALKEVPEAALAAQTMVIEPTIGEMSAALQTKNAIAQAQAPAQEAKQAPGKSAAKPVPSEPTVRAVEAAAPAKTADASSQSAGSAAAAAQASTAANEPSFEELKKAFLGLAGSKGQPVAKEVLAAFKIERLSGLTPEQYSEAMTMIKQKAA